MSLLTWHAKVIHAKQKYFRKKWEKPYVLKVSNNKKTISIFVTQMQKYKYL